MAGLRQTVHCQIQQQIVQWQLHCHTDITNSIWSLHNISVIAYDEYYININTEQS